MLGRMEKLKALSLLERQKLVYEWIKTGVITLREFRTLCENMWLSVDKPGLSR
jgi:hypothetical protein